MSVSAETGPRDHGDRHFRQGRVVLSASKRFPANSRMVRRSPHGLISGSPRIEPGVDTDAVDEATDSDCGGVMFFRFAPLKTQIGRLVHLSFRFLRLSAPRIGSGVKLNSRAGGSRR